MRFRCLLHIWVGVDCRPIASKIYQTITSNLIRKKTGCDEYIEDELNVASKSLPKYSFHDKDDKRYLEDICSVNGWSGKKAILNFFSALSKCSTRQFSYLSDPLFTFFANIGQDI